MTRVGGIYVLIVGFCGGGCDALAEGGGVAGGCGCDEVGEGGDVGGHCSSDSGLFLGGGL